MAEADVEGRRSVHWTRSWLGGGLGHGMQLSP